MKNEKPVKILRKFYKNSTKKSREKVKIEKGKRINILRKKITKILRKLLKIEIRKFGAHITYLISGTWYLA